MQYGEFWILETAVDWHVPFCYVDGPREFLQAQWNKPWHAMPRSTLLNTFERLQLSREIAVWDENGDEMTLTRAELNDEIEARERGPNVKAYGLTPKGGARWERFAKADWNRYHSYEWDIDNEDVLEIATTSHEVTERAFRYIVPWCDFRIFPETVERRTLHPWSVTYWKSLRIGYSVRFKCVEDRDGMITQTFSGMSDTEIRARFAAVHSEYEYFSDWYVKHPETPC